MTLTRSEWITALRSGKYTQGKSRLKDKTTNAFCCLGVACDLKDPNGWTYDTVCNTMAWGGCRSTIPTHLLKELGISVREESTLIVMNDSENKTFSEIADYLETRNDEK